MTSDELLKALFEAHEEATQSLLLSAIVDAVLPLVDRTLRRICGGWLSAEEVADIRSTVFLRLVHRLRRAANGSAGIERFDPFVVKLTSNAVNDHLRRRYPERTRLKNRLRYLLAHHPEFALWVSDGYLVCGLSAWRRSENPPRPLASMPNRLPVGTLDPRDSRASVTTILQHFGQPLLLDDVIALIEGASDRMDRPSPLTERMASTEPSAAVRVEQRSSLEWLWHEVQLLPSAQRVALLLNLRDADGGNALTHVVFLGIATFDEVALAVGLDREGLAATWAKLPMSDFEIAELLNLTRQQVINLRKTARRRLARRMERTIRRP